MLCRLGQRAVLTIHRRCLPERPSSVQEARIARRARPTIEHPRLAEALRFRVEIVLSQKMHAAIRQPDQRRIGRRRPALPVITQATTGRLGIPARQFGRGQRRICQAARMTVHRLHLARRVRLIERARPLPAKLVHRSGKRHPHDGRVRPRNERLHHRDTRAVRRSIARVHRRRGRAPQGRNANLLAKDQGRIAGRDPSFSQFNPGGGLAIRKS